MLSYLCSEILTFCLNPNKNSPHPFTELRTAIQAYNEAHGVNMKPID